MSQYTRLLRQAETKGWGTPGTHNTFAESVWISYWRQCAEYERKIAAGDTNPGRPVIPHRSGGGGV